MKAFGWKTWLGIGLLLITLVMTVVAFPTKLGENLQYITFISHLAIALTALDIIWSSRANEKLDGKSNTKKAPTILNKRGITMYHDQRNCTAGWSRCMDETHWSMTPFPEEGK